MIEPHPLSVRREALRQPYVTPHRRCHGIAEPLMAELVREQQLLATLQPPGREVTATEQRTLERLHGQSGHAVGDGDAVPVERVRAEVVVEVVDLFADGVD